MTPLDLHKIITESGLPEPWPCYWIGDGWQIAGTAVPVLNEVAAALFEVAFMDVLDSDGGILPHLTTGRLWGNDGKWFADLNNHCDPAILEHGESRLHALANVYRKLKDAR